MKQSNHSLTPKKTCKRFAKCGKYSLRFCQTWHEAPECADCHLTRFRRFYTEDGVVKKHCNRCGKLLPIHRFRVIKRAGQKDVLYSQCRMCEAERTRAYYYAKKLRNRTTSED